MTSQHEIVKPADQFALIKKTVKQAVPDLEQALANRLDPEFFIRCMLTSIKASPTLVKSTPASLVHAALESAALGLQIDGVLGYAYLVPFWNKHALGRDQGAYEAKFMPGYKGYLKLANDAGVTCWAHCVHAHDHFELDLGANTISHKVKDWGDRGEGIGAYACGQTKEGRVIFRFLPIEKLNTIRDVQLAQCKEAWQRKKHAWTTNEPEMREKSAVRALYKWLPAVGSEAQRKAAEDEQADLEPREPEFEVDPKEQAEAKENAAKAAEALAELEEPRGIVNEEGELLVTEPESIGTSQESHSNDGYPFDVSRAGNPIEWYTEKIGGTSILGKFSWNEIEPGSREHKELSRLVSEGAKRVAREGRPASPKSQRMAVWCRQLDESVKAPPKEPEPEPASEGADQLQDAFEAEFGGDEGGLEFE